MTAMARRWPLMLGLHLVVGVALAVALWVTHPFALSDVTLYYQWSGQVADGLVPYRDFFFDYPPLALLPMLVPRLLTGLGELTYGGYVVLFASVMALLSITLLLVGRQTVQELAPGRSAPHAFLVSMTLALSLMLIRFEPWPMLLTALALLAAVRGRAGWSGVWLGLGIAAKLYPAVLVLAFTAHWYFHGGTSQVARHLAGAIGTAVAVIGCVALVSGGAILDTLAFQQGRGLQVESAAGGIIQLIGLVYSGSLEVVHDTTYELRGPMVDAYIAVQPAIAAAVFLAVAIAALLRIRRPSPKPVAVLAATCIALLVAFMLTNRALSPQHVLWLLPFSLLESRNRQWQLVATFGVTLVLFPILYSGLLAGNLVAVLLLNIRNLLLAALLGLSLVWLPGRATVRRRVSG